EDVLPLAGVLAGTELPERLTVLRLSDGDKRVAYAAVEILEIASFAGALARADGRADLAGIALIEGEAFEVIDCHALFARHAGLSVGAGLSCRLEGDDGWMHNFLGPIVEAAGYRIVTGGEPADI